MGLEKVVADILEKGKEEVARIKAEAAAEVEPILKQAREEAAMIKAKKEAEIAKIVEKIRTRELASAKLEVKKIKLTSEKEALDQVYAHAMEKLRNLPKEKNERLLRALIEKGIREVGNGRIYCSQKDAELVKQMSSLELAGTINCIGGVLIESSDKTIKLDYTYETLLSSVWEKNVRQVANILFSR
jgi:V/A-type H+-transporting ATPase subunit E